jgi:hypothetical protein
MTEIIKHANVYSALCAAQRQMGPLIKSAKNEAFKKDNKPSRYAELADVVDVVRVPFSENGLAFFHNIKQHPDLGLCMETVLAHGDSGTFIECLVPMIVDRQNMHGLKSATTYAKRIGLESVSGVAPEDDDGNYAAAAAPSVPVFKAATSAHMKRELENLEHDLADTYTEVALESLWRSWAAKMNKEAWPTAEPDDETAYRNQVIFRFRDRKAEIQEKAEVAVEPPLRNPLMAGE